MTYAIKDKNDRFLDEFHINTHPQDRNMLVFKSGNHTIFNSKEEAKEYKDHVIEKLSEKISEYRSEGHGDDVRKLWNRRARVENSKVVEI